MRVALSQINPVVGDLEGNAARIRAWYDLAVDRGANLVVFPELALTGYPPRDLLRQADFVAAVERAAALLAGATGRTGLVFGAPLTNPAREGKPLSNGAILCAEGRVLAEVRKKLLPSYDVFDEGRYFEADESPARPVEFGGVRWGLHICEDAWNEAGFWPRRLYPRDPVEELAQAGAEVLLNISSSPFHAKKMELRRSMFASHAARHALPFLYTNQVGGNDELIFDGEGYVFSASGDLLACGRPFEEEMLFADVGEGSPRPATPLFSLDPNQPHAKPGPAAARPELDEIESIRRALTLGLRDYAHKCGFRSAVLGLSGGIDSALTAAIAAEALGPENVWGIALPSRYSSAGSVSDAEAVAKNLGIHFEIISIEPVFAASLESLDRLFHDTAPGLAEENLQARARAILLMALSNKFGHLLLATGNQSELAVGYCTLYGDMAGGLAVISDLPKTTVYAVAERLNRDREIIPHSTMVKPPSAELKPDQTDQDTLPPYDLLDRILEGVVEEDRGVASLVSQGLPEETVRRILKMVAQAEFKRRQAAPGLKISPVAFGSGRRMPIAARWPY
jgi:NAD+ synthase (glutamine-hydrolysing)